MDEEQLEEEVCREKKSLQCIRWFFVFVFFN